MVQGEAQAREHPIGMEHHAIGDRRPRDLTNAKAPQSQRPRTAPSHCVVSEIDDPLRS